MIKINHADKPSIWMSIVPPGKCGNSKLSDCGLPVNAIIDGMEVITALIITIEIESIALLSDEINANPTMPAKSTNTDNKIY
jgi:hypothetical protein